MEQNQNIPSSSFIISLGWNNLCKNDAVAVFIICPVCVCNAISHELDTQWKQNFNVTMIWNQMFPSKYESGSKKFKTSTTDKKVTSYLNVQIRCKSCLCFLNMPYF